MRSDFVYVGVCVCVVDEARVSCDVFLLRVLVIMSTDSFIRFASLEAVSTVFHLDISSMRERSQTTVGTVAQRPVYRVYGVMKAPIIIA